MIRNIGIIGTGGFSRELMSHIKNKYTNRNIQIFTDLKNNKKYKNIKSIDNFNEYNFLLGIGDPCEKKNIYNKLKHLNFINFIDDKNKLLDIKNINLGKGSIICKGSILTTNINLGIFSHINLNCTLGHDINIGDFFTCSPGVNISGNCDIGDNVFIGTNSAIREGIKICDNVIIGMPPPHPPPSPPPPHQLSIFNPQNSRSTRGDVG